MFFLNCSIDELSPIRTINRSIFVSPKHFPNPFFGLTFTKEPLVIGVIISNEDGYLNENPHSVFVYVSHPAVGLADDGTTACGQRSRAGQGEHKGTCLRPSCLPIKRIAVATRNNSTTATTPHKTHFFLSEQQLTEEQQGAFGASIDLW